MAHAHSSRLGLTWASIRDSLWFIPSIAVVVGTALAMIAVQIPTPRPESRFAWVWLFGGGAEGARGVLSAIAGSLITVTGVVFSVTIVALQLASSQFTPRVLRSFVADRINQAVLGVFIGTFTYTLLVLRTIHSTAGGREMFVPQVGVTFAVVLLLVSIGALIVFINHAARSVQAAVILHREAARTLERIDVLFPRRVGEAGSGEARRNPGADWRPPDDPPAVITATESGYLQSIDGETLWRAGAGRELMVRMELHVGAFAFRGKPIASVWPADLADERVARAVREAFVFGPERTPEQDVEYGVVALSDIAVRALSPGINDPTTAMHCIDRLTEILAVLSSRYDPDPVRVSPDGTMRLLVRGTPFDRAAGLAFDQIRHFGAGNVAIMKKLLQAVIDLAGVVRPEDRGALADQAEATLRAARRHVEDPGELAAVGRLADEALAATADQRLPSASAAKLA